MFGIQFVHWRCRDNAFGASSALLDWPNIELFVEPLRSMVIKSFRLNVCIIQVLPSHETFRPVLRLHSRHIVPDFALRDVPVNVGLVDDDLLRFGPIGQGILRERLYLAVFRLRRLTVDVPVLLAWNGRNVHLIKTSPLKWVFVETLSELSAWVSGLVQDPVSSALRLGVLNAKYELQKWEILLLHIRMHHLACPELLGVVLNTNALEMPKSQKVMNT